METQDRALGASKLRGYKSARKASIVQKIRQCFYLDYPDCEEPDEELLSKLRQGRDVAPSSAAAAAAASAPVVVPQAGSAPLPVTTAPITAHGWPGMAAALNHNANVPHYVCFGPPAVAFLPPGHPGWKNNNGPPSMTFPMPTLWGDNLQQAMALAAAQPVAAFAMMPQAPHSVHGTTPHGTLPRGAALPHERTPGSSAKRNHRQAFFAKPSFNASTPASNNNLLAANSLDSMTSSASRASISPATYIKPEGASGDPECTPLTLAEKHAVGELQQMAFTDPREILTSFRKLLRDNNAGRPPSVDEIMIDLITQREEAEEARKMDAARLMSEQARKGDAAQRREEIQRELQAAMEHCRMDEWLQNSQMFTRSWILRGSAKGVLQLRIGKSKTPLKCKLIELLKLERDARKWYKEMPRSYFARLVTQRLVGCHTTDSMLAHVQREIDTLTRVMFIMSEQLGGVPKVFRDAHDAVVAENNIDVDDDDDDAVHLVSGPPTSKNSGPKPITTQVSPTTNAVTFSNEVIDLS